MLQQLCGSYAKLRRNYAKLRCSYATSHYLIDLTGEVGKKCGYPNSHVNPKTTRATTFGWTSPKYYQLVSVCIEISESKFLTRM